MTQPTFQARDVYWADIIQDFYDLLVCRPFSAAAPPVAAMRNGTGRVIIH